MGKDGGESLRHARCTHRTQTLFHFAANSTETGSATWGGACSASGSDALGAGRSALCELPLRIPAARSGTRNLADGCGVLGRSARRGSLHRRLGGGCRSTCGRSLHRWLGGGCRGTFHEMALGVATLSSLTGGRQSEHGNGGQRNSKSVHDILQCGRDGRLGEWQKQTLRKVAPGLQFGQQCDAFGKHRPAAEWRKGVCARRVRTEPAWPARLRPGA